MRRLRLGRDFDLERRERARTRPEMPAPRIVIFIEKAGDGVRWIWESLVMVMLVVMMGGSA